MPEAPLLRTEALTRGLRSLIAVDRVDVAVRRGELRSIIGPTARQDDVLPAHLGRDDADLRPRVVRSAQITGLPQHAVARLGITKSYQITNVFPHLSVHENVRVACRLDALVQLLSRADALTDVAERARAAAHGRTRRESRAPGRHLAHGEKRHSRSPSRCLRAAAPVARRADGGMSPEETTRRCG